jgi:hypothetical protein
MTVWNMHINRRTKFIVLNLPVTRRGGNTFHIFLIYRHNTNYIRNQLNNTEEQQDNIRLYLLTLLMLLVSSSLDISTLQIDKPISIITSAYIYHTLMFSLRHLIRFWFIDGARGGTTETAWCQSSYTNYDTKWHTTVSSLQHHHRTWVQQTSL